jgi:hypothetical protein
VLSPLSYVGMVGAAGFEPAQTVHLCYRQVRLSRVGALPYPNQPLCRNGTLPLSYSGLKQPSRVRDSNPLCEGENLAAYPWPNARSTPSRARTEDPRLKRTVLYQLS